MVHVLYAAFSKAHIGNIDFVENITLEKWKNPEMISKDRNGIETSMRSVKYQIVLSKLIIINRINYLYGKNANFRVYLCD